ncbi:MAG TPA: restriction endonuclease subunit S [Euryarchaeota archaeon]|nr:restriction endonuclease subunit S [Euryarchaeota archaeon]
MKWAIPALGQIATITGGSTPSRTQAEYWNGSIPWLTPTDLPMPGKGIADVSDTAAKITEEGLAAISAQLLPVGTVLFSSRATIGKLGISRVPLATNQGFANFIPKRFVDAKYLAYCLLRHKTEITALAGSTTFKEVTKTALKKFRVPLPPLSEQRRIVEILDQADALRRKRAEADAKAARILPALFYKIFGDPVTNPKGWPIKRISEVCRVISGATPRTNQPEYWGGGIPWATPRDLSGLDDWVLEQTERTLTGEGLSSCSATMMPKGAVLLSSRAPIGLVAIAGVPMCTNQGFKNLICEGDIDSWYLFAWCKLRKSYLQSLGRGATFTEVSKSIVESIELPLPPIKTQREFRERVNLLRSIHEQRRISLRQIENTFQVLLHRAFTGDLTAKWREAHMKELLKEMEEQTRYLDKTH